MVNQVWQFAMPPSLKFGRGCRNSLPQELARLGVRTPIVVTDPIVGQLDQVQALLDELRTDFRIAVFDGGIPEPTIDVAVQACTLAHTSKSDGVIGIGGGSNLDIAKIVALVGRHGGEPQDYFGFDKVPGPVLPMFALPTTAGTGSEVSHSAVLTDASQSIKVSTLSRWLRPTAALVDPELSDGCPPRVSAHSGIDALVHAIEAYTNRSYAEMVDVDPQTRAYEGSFPFTRLLAAEAIRLIGRSLVRVCTATPSNQSSDLAERTAITHCRDEMALAATLAGMAFSNSGVGIVHALEYPLGGLTGVGHGEGNGLLLPHVMRYNLPVRLEEFAEIAGWLGADVAGRSLSDAASAAVEHVQAMLQTIGIRTRLSQLGVERSQIPQLAAKAFEIKRLMQLNPQPVSQADLEEILSAAF